MREQIERITNEALEEIIKLNLELDASTADDIGHAHELEHAFREAAATLIETKQTLKQKLRLRCEEIIADIQKLQVAMPDVSGPSMSELKPPFKPLLQKLESQTQEFRSIATQRSERRNAAIMVIRDVCAHMDIMVPEFEDSLTENDITELEAKANTYRANINDRKARISQLKNEISDMCSFLAEQIPSLSDDLSERTLTAVLQIHTSLERKYSERKEELGHLELQVMQLAELLECPGEVNTTGNVVNRLKAAELRLAELNDLKRKCISQVIGKARMKIMESWDELCVDQRHRGTVTAMVTQETSETVLEALETERLSLQALEQDSNRQNIVKLLREYAELREQEQKLAEASRDPKRLAQRGFSQILKREEATRKLLERKKPPLVQQLLPLLEQWTVEHNGESFTLNGEQVSDLIEQERAKFNRRSRTSLPLKRPMSSNTHQASEQSAAKRVKPALSTPMLRSRNARLARIPPPPGAPVASAARPRTVVSRSQNLQAVSTMSQNTSRPRASAHNDTINASNREAAMRAAATKAASRAVKSQANHYEQLRSREISHRPAVGPLHSMTSQSQNSPRTVPSHGQISHTIGPSRRIELSRSRPQTQPRTRSQQLHKQPSVQSTPIDPQPNRQPLTSQRPSVVNTHNQPMDWRAQRKADLQENGLSYYDDSTAELSAPPGEESFDFKNFF